MKKVISTLCSILPKITQPIKEQTQPTTQFSGPLKKITEQILNFDQGSSLSYRLNKTLKDNHIKHGGSMINLGIEGFLPAFHKILSSVNTKNDIGTIIHSNFYVICRDLITQATQVDAQNNKHLKEINDMLIANGFNEYKLLNAAHIEYLKGLLNNTPCDCKVIYYLQCAANEGLVNKIEMCEKINNLPNNEIFLLLNECNENEKAVINAKLTNMNINFDLQESVAINEAIYNMFGKFTMAFLYDNETKILLYKYLKKLLESDYKNQIQLTPEQKIHLAINLIDCPHIIKSKEYASLLNTAYQFTKQTHNVYNSLWDMLPNTNWLSLLNENDTIVFNTFCHKRAKNLELLSPNEKIGLFYVFKNNHIENETFCNAIINDTSINKSSSSFILTLVQLNYGKVYNIMISNNIRKEIEEINYMDFLNYASYMLLSNYYSMLISIEKAMITFLKGDGLYDVMKYMLIHYSNIQKLFINITSLNNCSIPKATQLAYLFANKFNLILYQTAEKKFKFMTYYQAIMNPQTIQNSYNTANEYNYYHIDLFGISNHKPIVYKKNEFAQIAVTHSSLLFKLYTINLCRTKRIKSFDVLPLFLNDEFITVTDYPLLLFYSAIFNLNYCNAEEFERHMEKINLDTICTYLFVRPHLENLRGIKEYDRIFTDILKKLKTDQIKSIIYFLSRIICNFDYSKPLLAHIVSRFKGKLRHSNLIDLKISTQHIPESIKFHSAFEWDYCIKACTLKNIQMDTSTIYYHLLSENGAHLFSLFKSGLRPEILFNILNVPSLFELMIKSYKDEIMLCLEKSENWLLYLFMKYTAPPNTFNINSILDSKIRNTIENSKYIISCIEDVDFNADLDNFDLTDEIYPNSTPNELTFPYYSKKL